MSSARKSLKIAHTRQWIDHESFLAYGIGLSFFTLGAVGSIGSDDVLACFVAGNSLTWRDFYRIEVSARFRSNPACAHTPTALG